MPQTDLKDHWNKAYKLKDIEELGWYEASAKPSLDLINKCNLDKNASILNVGSGATILVDELIAMGFDNVIATDISENALDKLKTRLNDKTGKTRFIVDDLTNPVKLNHLEPVDLWHDRAVLHFFNKKEDQDAYFDLLKKLVKQKGYVIIATFNLNGALKCSGLPVHRYDENMLKEKLGSDFMLIEQFDFTFTMPSGDTREYIYTLFNRK